MNDIKQWAPIVIPTLNRYEHFRKCFESLEACVGADQTEIFIGLDYPPSEKYVEGWEKIDDFLTLKERNNGFKRLHVIRREHNYGIGPNGNWDSLEKEIVKTYNTFIASEDDNIFASNALLYFNRGLEKFRDDKRIIYICGYTHPYPFKTEGTTYYMHNTDMSAWGYATWSDRYVQMIDELRKDVPENFSIANFLKVRKRGYNRALQYLSLCIKQIHGFRRMTDNVMSVYAIVHDLYFVQPSKTLVRNIGWDGSGLACASRTKQKGVDIALRHMNQEIDNSNDFVYSGDPWKYCDYNNQIARQYSDGLMPYYQYLWSLVKFLAKSFLKYIWLIFHK